LTDVERRVQSESTRAARKQDAQRDYNSRSSVRSLHVSKHFSHRVFMVKPGGSFLPALADSAQ